MNERQCGKYGCEKPVMGDLDICEYHHNAAISLAELRARRRASGLCTQCGEPTAVRFNTVNWRCETCKAAAVVCSTKTRARARAAAQPDRTARLGTLIRNAYARPGPCDLNEHRMELIDRLSKNKCELTGLPFDYQPPPNDWRNNPDAPSLDAIKPKGGHVYSNIRVVLTAVNMALNEFGLDVLLRWAYALIRNPANAARIKQLKREGYIK